ncbi:hypothetical protein [Rhodovulum sp. MB263]|uniref:hypothetical protein n=1 Tax=Rhodovulum sp. (strain MB263) TaxID=308754 RepID=UPI0012DB658A|nr:hypothetical protein [Rhodovulum sp. MB263]
MRRSSLTAGLLHQIETALSEVYGNAPMGYQVVPFPESQEVDLETLGAGFRGRRGRVLVRESVNVSAAGGPVPTQDWKPQDVTPNLSGMMPDAMLTAARAAICECLRGLARPGRSRGARSGCQGGAAPFGAVGLAASRHADASVHGGQIDADAAQERGEVSSGGGRPDCVEDRNAVPATAADLGLRRDEIHEARGCILGMMGATRGAALRRA